MVNLDIKYLAPENISCESFVIGLFEDITPGPTFKLLDKTLNGLLATVLSEHRDYAKFGETTVVYISPNTFAKRIIIIGLGKQHEITLDKFRKFGAMAVKPAQKETTKILAYQLPDCTRYSDTALAQAIVEGAILGNYTFDHYKTNKVVSSLEKIIINCSLDTSVKKKEVSQALIVANCVNFTRDLVNHPSQYMTPAKMADVAQALASDNNIECKILEKDELMMEGMNLLLAVAKGSVQPPKFIILKYTGYPEKNEYIAFVGKGITFDSGGICLKPSAGMEEMKGDMAGGAAVLGAIKAISELKLPANIIGLIPCTENMPDGGAVKPGDVIIGHNGKTVEIINTDAEGRLILADALSYAKSMGAAKIIDLATLTGACVVALGNITSGIISNNQQWCDMILKAANQSGEKMWQLPAFDEYKELIKSDIADIKNSGGREGGTITAGLFLKEFVADTPWIHIDIAGTSDAAKAKGYNPKGATGVGVRTLVTLVKGMIE